MFLEIGKYFLLFLIYSFLGWCIEVVIVSLERKKIVNRGFLIGPYCPIYGFGALLITLVLGRYQYDPLVLFVMTVAACGTLEYITSWAMEVIFKARWWDYGKEKFNLNGRICLKNLIAFGVLGLLITYFLSPMLLELMAKLGDNIIIWIAAILEVIFFVDCIISFVVIFNFRKITKKVNNERVEDNTEQITAMVRRLFAEQSFFNRRFINAYPKLVAIKTKIKEIKDKITDNVNGVKDNLSEKKEVIKDNIERTTRKTKASIYLGKKTLKKKLKKKGK